MNLQRNSRTVVAAALAVMLALSGCAAMPLSGDDLSAAEIGERAQEKYENIDSITGTVTTSMQSEETNQTSTARVWLKPQTGEMRYEFTAPESQSGNVMVSNGSVMSMYNASENEVRRTDISGLTTSATATNFTRMFEYVFEQFDASYEGTATVGDRSAHVLRLTPKNESESALISEMSVWVDKDHWFPIKTESTVRFGNETIRSTNTYTNLTFNTDIPAETFEFDPPEGATVETRETPEFSEYESVAEADAAVSFAVAEPSERPEGYELSGVTVTNGSEHESVSLAYENESKTLFVRQSTRAGLTDGEDAETVSVNGREAVYRTFGSTKSLSWTCDGRTYSVAGSLSKETLVEVAASLDCES